MAHVKDGHRCHARLQSDKVAVSSVGLILVINSLLTKSCIARAEFFKIMLNYSTDQCGRTASCAGSS